MADRKNRAMATWRGDLKSGMGTMSTSSGSFEDIEFTFATRFGEELGTNPEELIGAAQAACFSMQLSGILTQGGHSPTHIETEATVGLKYTGKGFKISTIHLQSRAEVSGIDNETFQKAVQTAKEICPVSVLISPGLDEFTVEAVLE